MCFATRTLSIVLVASLGLAAGTVAPGAADPGRPSVEAPRPSDAPGFVPAPAGTTPIPGRYLVLLEDEAVGVAPGKAAEPATRELADELGALFEMRRQRLWSDAIHGFVAEMTPKEARRLARYPFVAQVAEDYTSEALSVVTQKCSANFFGTSNTRPLPTPNSQGFWNQSLNCADPAGDCEDNWGLARIDQFTTYNPNNASYTVNRSGAGVTIAILDTGIRADHREFEDLSGNSRVSPLSRNFYSGDPPSDIDESALHSHGTLIAGIAAGRTYGVAKLADLLIVRVCRRNDCALSDVVAGINYITGLKKTGQIGPTVASLSANESAWNGSFVLIKAVNALHGANVQLFQSAGNQGESACTHSFGQNTPTFVVGGIGVDDQRMDLQPDDEEVSNHGPCLDLFAPAENIVSAARNSNTGNRFCKLGGTSMAAPFAAGVAALFLEANPTATAAQVHGHLRAQAWAVIVDPATNSPNKILRVPFL